MNAPHFHIVKQVAVGTLNLAIFYFMIRWVVENIRPGVLVDALARISPTAIAYVIVANTVAVIFCSLRLAVLLRKPFGVSIYITNLGLGFNAILPLRMGDLTRIYYAKQLFSLSATNLLANALLEKFFDLIALGSLVVVVLLISGTSYIGAGLAEILFALILVGLIAIVAFHKFSYRLEKMLSEIDWARILVAGLRSHSRVHDLPRVSGYTLAIWLTNVGVVYIGFSCLLPTVGLGLFDAVALLLITALAIAIPGAPSGLGVFEAGIVAYLIQSFHIENELALACAFAFHMAITIPQVVVAIGIVIRGRLLAPKVTAGS